MLNFGNYRKENIPKEENATVRTIKKKVYFGDW